MLQKLIYVEQLKVLSELSGMVQKETEEGNYTHRVACVRGCDFQDIKNGLRGKTPECFILEKNFQTSAVKMKHPQTKMMDPKPINMEKHPMKADPSARPQPAKN